MLKKNKTNPKHVRPRQNPTLRFTVTLGSSKLSYVNYFCNQQSVGATSLQTRYVLHPQTESVVPSLHPHFTFRAGFRQRGLGELKGTFIQRTGDSII